MLLEGWKGFILLVTHQKSYQSKYGCNVYQKRVALAKENALHQRPLHSVGQRSEGKCSHMSREASGGEFKESGV